MKASKDSRRRRASAAAAIAVAIILLAALILNDDDGRGGGPEGRRSLRADRTITIDDLSRPVPGGTAAATPVPPAPYTLADAVAEASVWKASFALVVYDPEEDKFTALYSEGHQWKSGTKKIIQTIKLLTKMLRRTFPDRFGPGATTELVLAVAGSDYPHVDMDRLPHGDGAAPVLVFGSVFADPTVYPNMIGMPMNGLHLSCFNEFSKSGTVCEYFRPESRSGGGYDVAGWEDLAPQLVWRGTDFLYLPTLTRSGEGGPRYRRPSLGHEEFGRLGPEEAARVLSDEYDALMPRWKAVALSVEAELEARDDPRSGPWADMKFTAGPQGKKLEGDAGVTDGPSMNREVLAGYRYQIDLGGGGGTTWTGTTDKLAMPGLLFHHVTHTKDYIHDRLAPWVHYVPVSADLRDLKERFDWAESHPEEAEKIAGAATAFMRRLGTPEGFGEMFDDVFVGNLRNVIGAYRPVPPGTNWREVLEWLPGGRGMVPILECDASGVCKGGYTRDEMETMFS